jgi:fibronectin-binding autotransporter adhesin
VQLAFTDPQNFFGLYWGSMDDYNSISFLKNQKQIAMFSGTVIASLTGLAANGDQQSPYSNRYVNFNLGEIFYDEVILATTDFGFEVDNIASGDPPEGLMHERPVHLKVVYN